MCLSLGDSVQMCVRVRVMPMTSIRDEFQADLNQSTSVLHCSNSACPLLFVWLFFLFSQVFMRAQQNTQGVLGMQEKHMRSQERALNVQRLQGVVGV